jgi:hypothetical protein
LQDLTFIGFKREILLIFKNPLYEFNLNNLYYIHLFEPDGTIIGKLPFRLFSLNDDEDCIEDYYNKLVIFMSKYLDRKKDLISTGSYVGLYISTISENEINTKHLYFQKENCLNNIRKMHIDFILPIYLDK